jgi:hypothetical protein
VRREQLVIRLMTCSLLLFCCSTAAFPAAPTEETKPVLYFPTTVGTRWEYESDEVVSIKVITDVKDVEGGKQIDIGHEKKDGKVTHDARWVVSEKGLYLPAGQGAGGLKLKEPCWILKLPHKDGNKWDTVISIEPGKWGGVSTASGPEEVKVPAGTYQALVVRYEGNAPGQEKVVITRWFAPDVGKVKEVYDKKASVLKRFTPGK